MIDIKNRKRRYNMSVTKATKQRKSEIHNVKDFLEIKNLKAHLY